MANTPLELYEDAYRLHYHEKKIPEAIKVYEALIRDFPDSNECSYAVIQLQKVKATDITKALKKGATTLYPLIIVAFMSSFIALLVAIVGTLFLFQQLRLEHHRSTLAVAALGKMYGGKEEDALKLLEEMKSFSSQDVLVSELSADIANQQNSPSRSAPPQGVSNVSPAPSDKVPQTPQAAGTKNVYIVSDKPVEKPPVRPRQNPPERRPARQNRNPVVNQDSISYF
jgi:hypothetical protein